MWAGRTNVSAHIYQNKTNWLFTSHVIGKCVQEINMPTIRAHFPHSQNIQFRYMKSGKIQATYELTGIKDMTKSTVYK